MRKLFYLAVIPLLTSCVPIGVRVQNIIGSYDLPWDVVRAVSFGRGTPWLALDLHDDERVAVMAVQMADKGDAVQAARRLRALHTASLSGSVVE